MRAMTREEEILDLVAKHDESTRARREAEQELRAAKSNLEDYEARMAELVAPPHGFAVSQTSGAWVGDLYIEATMTSVAPRQCFSVRIVRPK